MRDKMIRIFFSLFVAVILSFLFNGCTKNIRIEKQELAIKDKNIEVKIPETQFDEFIILNQVYFEFDKFNLLPESRKVLKENAKNLKRVSLVPLVIEGHCDDRGTLEYNIALGQERAEAVKDFYRSVGIKNRIKTISFGEERILSKTNHKINRRVNTLILAQEE